MTFIWATRGRSWGFRFIHRGGFDDPLPPYESVFVGMGGQLEGCLRAGERVGLRLLDPEGRTDRSGRIIPHDFVLFGDLAFRVHTVDDGLREVWPLVVEEFAHIWELPQPPDLTAGTR